MCSALVLASCSLGLGQDSQPTAHILFIGNSYTFFNDGIDHELEGLAPTVMATSLAKAGYSLKDHWTDEETVPMIQDGLWDYVVLQEQSQRPVLDPAGFLFFARALDGTIRDSGAQTILMMTWERPDSASGGVTTANLAVAYDIDFLHIFFLYVSFNFCRFYCLYLSFKLRDFNIFNWQK